MNQHPKMHQLPVMKRNPAYCSNSVEKIETSIAKVKENEEKKMSRRLCNV